MSKTFWGSLGDIPSVSKFCNKWSHEMGWTCWKELILMPPAKMNSTIQHQDEYQEVKGGLQLSYCFLLFRSNYLNLEKACRKMQP